MELTLETLNKIIANLPRNIEAKDIMVMLEIKDVISSDIYRIGFEIVYDADGSVNTGILKINATGGMITTWTENEGGESNDQRDNMQVPGKREGQGSTPEDSEGS